MPDQDDQSLKVAHVPTGPEPAKSETIASQHFVAQGLLNGVEVARARGEHIVAHLQGRGDVSMSTDEIMALTRGE